MDEDKTKKLDDEIIDEVIASFAIDDIVVTKEEIEKEKEKPKVKRKVRIEDDSNDG